MQLQSQTVLLLLSSQFVSFYLPSSYPPTYMCHQYLLEIDSYEELANIDDTYK